MIRTTISLPADIHERIKLEATEKGQSFGDTLLQEILENRKAKLKASFERIDKIAKKINTKGINYKELINYGRKY